MTTLALIFRSLRFYWRTHLGVLFGSTLACAVLVGALAVGDSVNGTLRSLALSRLGTVELALRGGERMVRAGLADDLAGKLSVPAAAVLQLDGLASSEDETARANHVQVLGVDGAFWKLGGTADPLVGAADDEVVLSISLARRLRAAPGDTIRLRVDKPSLLPRDAPLSAVSDFSRFLPLRVRALADDAHFGRFGLENSQLSPCNAFVSREVLARKVGLKDKANLILLGQTGDAKKPVTVASASAALGETWQLGDAQLTVRELPRLRCVELRSERVFLDDAVTHAATSAGAASSPTGPKPTELLTYFAKELRAGEKSTPYSVVTANLPDDMAGKIVITDWLADDLNAKIGQKLTMTYLSIGPMLKLEEHSAEFTIADIVPLSRGDRDMLPDYPGLANVDDIRGWKPGITIDFSKIRKKDDDFWRDHRGTPKAFISLCDGQKLWGNRFGNLTAVRWDANEAKPGQIRDALRRNLSPAAMGLFFQPVRERALAAGNESLDFGQLFLSLSFFLIVAAMLLTAMLFSLGVRQRQAEAGLLLAIGWPTGKVRRMLLLEGSALALAGAVLGVPLGLAYTRGLLYGLSGAWSGAVTGASIDFHANIASIAAGAVSGVAASVLAVWLASRRLFCLPARELLAGADALPAGASKQNAAASLGLCLALAAATGGVLVWSILSGGSVGMFFAAGGLGLLLAIAVLRHALLLAGSSESSALTLQTLAVRNSARRRSRSLAVMTLLACGAFLIVSVAANRQGSAPDTGAKISGTGGFSLYGESSLPVLRDLGDPNGQKAYALDRDAMAGVTVVQLRVQGGDDASCFNLNHAQSPRLLGALPADLAGRFEFERTLTPPPAGNAWELLSRRPGDANDEVRAIGDEPTVTWGLRKKLGETLAYTDERGRTFKVRIVGVMQSSLFQGNLIISRQDFEARFPSQSGYRMFLVDAAPARAEGVSKALSRALLNYGLELTSAPARLNEFNTVQDTYLAIFLVLGGLAMLLGSAGLALVVARNVLERRGELAILQAVGLQARDVRRMILLEHWGLLTLGLLGGTLAACAAVMPVRGPSGAHIPWAWLAGLLLSGLAWTLLASIWATRGNLLAALRNE